MSDKNKEKDELDLENPDFSLNIEDDELELNIEDDIFSSGEELDLEENKNIEEDDEILSEDELESLIIGIDEENDILDIPDEEEVLEELKFLDENFSLEEENEDDEDEIKEVNEKEKFSNKFRGVLEKPIFKKIKSIGNDKLKNEKKENIKKPTKKKESDIKYFLIKHRFKVMGTVASSLFLVFVLALIFRSPKPLVEDLGKVEKALDYSEIRPTIRDLSSILDHLTTKERLAYYRERLANEAEDNQEIIELNNRIRSLEKTLENEAREKREAYIESLRREFSGELSSVRPASFKTTENRLQIGFLVTREDFYDDLYKAIEQSFLKNRDIKNINIVLFTAGRQLNKEYELNVARHQFDAVRNISDSNKNKVKRLNLIAR